MGLRGDEGLQLTVLLGKPVFVCMFGVIKMWYENIAGRFFGLVTKHACDRRTDRQNYDSQDRASIASRGKNTRKSLIRRRTDHFNLIRQRPPKVERYLTATCARP